MPADSWLERSTFLEVIRHAPLVSIDLIVTNPSGELLLGRRNNAPARGYWFVPGGRVLKAERLETAFARIARSELGLELARRDARLLGVFEHHYDDNVAGLAGVGTHYVVLAHAVGLRADALPVPDDQHGAYRWWAPAALCRSAEVHPYTKDYVGPDGAARPLDPPQ